MDQLAHACLQAGVAAATPNILRHKHLQVNEVPALLKEVRGKGHEAGIMVITEGLFSMDSDIPQIGALQDACKEYEAVLVVDVAHDFGSLGPNGTGALGLQGLIGKVDLVMGSFSKTFSSNGGFVATHSAAVRDFLRIFSSPHTFSNALSPIQSAIILECLRIVRSEEGEQRRQKMLSISRLLRDELAKEGITCIGEPSPIVPAIIGREPLARLAARRLRSHSIFANLVEFPAVGVNKARFRLQVMADHEPHQAVAAAKAVSASISEATRDLDELMAASATQGE
jgi:7-keto-8-aminopelargonate synthetase-like enzyme